MCRAQSAFLKHERRASFMVQLPFAIKYEYANKNCANASKQCATS